MAVRVPRQYTEALSVRKARRQRLSQGRIRGIQAITLLVIRHPVIQRLVLRRRVIQRLVLRRRVIRLRTILHPVAAARINQLTEAARTQRLVVGVATAGVVADITAKPAFRSVYFL